MRRAVVPVAVVVVALLAAVPAASAHRLNIRAVRAVAESAVDDLYARGGPWPGVVLDRAWVGSCWRHGSHWAACRIWAQYSRTDELGAHRVQLCNASISAQAEVRGYRVKWLVPAGMDCREVTPMAQGR